MKDFYAIFSRVTILGGLGLGAFALSALATSYTWQEPASEPPNNNVDAPIDVGPAKQVKTGLFGLNGLVFKFPGTTVIPGSVLMASSTDGQVRWSGPEGFASYENPNCVTKETSPTETGDFPVSLVINGRNICNGNNGCGLRAWTWDANGFYYLIANAYYREIKSTGQFIMAGRIYAGTTMTKLTGKHGDSVEDQFWSLPTTAANNCALYADKPSFTPGSDDLFILTDNTSSIGCGIKVCEVIN